MTIFPSIAANGQITRNEDGTAIAVPNAENVYNPPVEFDFTCPPRALQSDCFSRIEPAQINAIVSEMVCLAATFSPSGVWDCSSLCNIAAAFNTWAEENAVCNAEISDGEEVDAALVYCLPSGLRLKFPIQGPESLLAMFLEAICIQSSAGNADSSLDNILYCDADGVLKKVGALAYSLFQGAFIQARGYTTNHMVRLDGRLWTPNAVIPPGTAFVEGTAGATWYEVSATHITEHNPALAYPQLALVSHNSIIYRATAAPVAVGAFNEAQWEALGERSKYRGEWVLANAYRIKDMVDNGNALYTANSAIAANTAFVVGAGANQWTEVSAGDRSKYRGPWLLASSYLSGDMVEKDSFLYVANSNIAANTAFLIGVGVDTWREVSAGASDGVPIGALVWFTGSVAPAGYVEANANQVTPFYPDLRAFYIAGGSPFGSAGGNPLLPDLRGEFIRGWDHGKGTDVGRVFGSAQLDAMQQITGTVASAPATGFVLATGTTAGAFGTTGSKANGPAAAASANAKDITFDSANSPGARTAAETRGRNVALLPCIKAFGAVSPVGMADLIQIQTDFANYIAAHMATDAQAIAGALTNVLMNPANSKAAIDAAIALALPAYTKWRTVYDQALPSGNFFLFPNLGAYEFLDIWLRLQPTVASANAGRLELSSDNCATFVTTLYYANNSFQDSTPAEGGSNTGTGAYIAVADITGLAAGVTAHAHVQLYSFNKAFQTGYQTGFWGFSPSNLYGNRDSKGMQNTSVAMNGFRLNIAATVVGSIIVEGKLG